MSKIEGTIKLIEEAKSFGSNGFTKRIFVLTTDEKYPQDVALELYNDSCNAIDEYKVGDRIEAEYNVRGSEYNGKYFVNLNAWRIEMANKENNPATPQPAIAEGVDEDLPF